MPLKTFRLCCAGLLLLTTPAFAADEAVPSAVALLRQAVKAHAKPGPMTIVTSMTGPADGREIRVTTTIRRNDPTHFGASASMTMGPIKMDDGILQWYRNGNDKVFYDGTENVYHKGFAPSPFPPDLIGELLSEVGKGLGSEKSGEIDLSEFEDGMVTGATHDGLAVWRITVPDEAPAPGKVPETGEMLIGKDDGLVRLAQFTDEDGTYVFTSTYTVMDAPFPPETFRFKPPAGARLIPAPKPAPKKPAPKPPAKKAPAKKTGGPR